MRPILRLWQRNSPEEPANFQPPEHNTLAETSPCNDSTWRCSIDTQALSSAGTLNEQMTDLTTSLRATTNPLIEGLPDRVQALGATPPNTPIGSLTRRVNPLPDSDTLEDFDENMRLPSPEANPEMEFAEETQPEAEDGVTRNMSLMALKTGTLNASDLERFAGADLQPSALHLGGDFRDMEDSAIMLELKAGNMAGFDFLMQKYRKPIINFMYRMTRNQAVAEELAQEVFLRVYRSRETYRAEARFSTWLYRIATNLGVNRARDTRHERAASTVYLDETDLETGTSPDVADTTPGAEARLLRDERMAAIREQVMALPERQRMGVLMHKYEGMDYKQIGDVLKLSESATKSLLFRAYQSLREKLKDFV
jgi:RNA polymerase sigma-70 factor (ECF subfamily)